MTARSRLVTPGDLSGGSELDALADREYALNLPIGADAGEADEHSASVFDRQLVRGGVDSTPGLVL
jgi:hypothetical protein